ncbi:RagB/SusD family nutrient uptake outer membrane protein [Saccharicrinis sp. FJH2]|uniref:RagB/SusD family nutrient uptake outer membrane protein n=1 Tax=Saccharicrinis sp. FJH65 TaxID=3344659 RepID=UPI0035F2AB81
MKTYRILIIIASIFWISACNLDTEIYENLPADKFPENEGQLESITLSAYTEQRHLLDDWGWWLYMQEVTSDFLVFPQRGTDWEDDGKWRVLHRHTWNSTTIGVQSMWSHLYSGVVRCNQALEYFQADSEAATLARAEMKVLRSYLFYLLIDNYGAVPYSESFSNAESNPYRVKRADIYNRLITVVTEAIPDLPEPGTVDNYKISKAMAYMLLGKLYLNGAIYKGDSNFNVNDMDSVAKYMNLVINSGYQLESDRLGPFKVDNAASSEVIFSILGDENADDGMRHNFRTLHTLHQKTYDLQSSPWNGCAVKPDYYEKLFAPNDGYDNPDDNTSVNDEIVDQRASAFLRGQQYDIDGNELSNDNGKLILTQDIKADIMTDATDGAAVTRFSGYRVVKFEVEIGSGPIMNNDFPVFRLADAYLMRAEATLRGATLADASADDDLNQTRTKAGLPSVTATLSEVLDERGRELFLEGHRRSDLIRFGLFADRNWWLGATESGEGAERRVFPLPQDQLDANPNLNSDPVNLQL